LLTERNPNGLLDLFEDGVHFVTYTPRDPQDAATKIRTLLTDPERMHRIAATGRAEILRAHLATHRAIQLEEILVGLSKTPRDPRRHFGAMMNLHVMSNLMSDVNPGYSRELLRLSLESIRKAATECATPNSTEAAYTAKSCLRYDLLTGDTEGAQTIFLCAEAFPTVPLFSLLKIRALLNTGRGDEAKACASSLSSSMPLEQLFSSAEHAANMLME
jgi:hypothetical protein